MTALTLELQNEYDVDLLLMLANRINAKIIDSNNIAKTYSSSPIDLLDKIADNGGVAGISEPSLWQSEIRKDSALFGRE
jgi:hypothetical protein